MGFLNRSRSIGSLPLPAPSSIHNEGSGSAGRGGGGGPNSYNNNPHIKGPKSLRKPDPNFSNNIGGGGGGNRNNTQAPPPLWVDSGSHIRRASSWGGGMERPERNDYNYG